MLLLRVPVECRNEIEYITGIIFDDWLCIDYVVAFHDSPDFCLISENKSLLIRNVFFENTKSSWLDPVSLPVLPLQHYNLLSLPSDVPTSIPKEIQQLPVLYGFPKIRFNDSSIDCMIDIFGSIFFMISRYEEAIIGKRDIHDRFPLMESVAHKEGFVHRPIVNEYLELLWSLMKRLWPGLKRRERNFRIQPSHDVDVPYDDAFRRPHQMVRRAVRDVLKNRNIFLMLKNYSTWRSVRKGNLEIDRYNTFDFIAEESEKRLLKSAFYFLPSGSPEQDMNAPICHPVMRGLIKSLANRGHEIGLHGHYFTYLSQEDLIREVEILRQVLDDGEIVQVILGGRQHFLRWKNPDTFRIWEAAGLDYDSTLGFPERPGFRCGTCYEYPAYDVLVHRKLKLIEKPLIAMDVSVAASRYMAKGYSHEAYDVFKQVKDACRSYKGDFVLLWHNSHLITEQQRELYRAVLDA